MIMMNFNNTAVVSLLIVLIIAMLTLILILKIIKSLYYEVDIGIKAYTCRRTINEASLV